MTDHSQRIQDIKIRDALCKMYDALKAADVEYSALSTNGINIFAADRKSIDACAAALDRAAQWDGLCRNLRHWQEECGKIHSQLDASLSRERALREALEAVEEAFRLAERPAHIDPVHGAEVEELGDRIGYGALMSSASASWRKRLADSGKAPVGGEFVAGPCHSTVVRVLKIARAALQGKD